MGYESRVERAELDEGEGRVLGLYLIPDGTVNEDPVLDLRRRLPASVKK